jgi:hypothetical protein
MKRVSVPNVLDRPVSRGKAEVRAHARWQPRARRARGARPSRTQPCADAPLWARQVSLSAFAFLFSELVQYNQSRVSNINELERRRAHTTRESRPNPSTALLTAAR